MPTNIPILNDVFGVMNYDYISPSQTTPQDSINHIINGDVYMKYVKYALIGLAGLYVYNKWIK